MFINSLCCVLHAGYMYVLYRYLNKNIACCQDYEIICLEKVDCLSRILIVSFSAASISRLTFYFSGHLIICLFVCLTLCWPATAAEERFSCNKSCLYSHHSCCPFTVKSVVIVSETPEYWTVGPSTKWCIMFFQTDIPVINFDLTKCWYLFLDKKLINGIGHVCSFLPWFIYLFKN